MSTETQLRNWTCFAKRFHKNACPVKTNLKLSTCFWRGGEGMYYQRVVDVFWRFDLSYKLSASFALRPFMTLVYWSVGNFQTLLQIILGASFV